MSESEIPPVLSEVEAQPTRAKWRWLVSVLLLAGYVLGIGIAGPLLKGDGGSTGPAMPDDLGSLMRLCAVDLGMFAAVFAIAWLFSRARRAELFLKWRGGVRPVLWGIAYSIGLRVAVMIIGAIMVAPIYALKGEKAIEGFRPKTESLINTKALKDPAYATFMMTVVSFGMAGFREELWRVGMMAGLAGLAPAVFATRRGQYIAVAIAAVIFGLGHAPQGWGGVVLTGALGLGLGWIIVRHQSIWEAVMAHGFFDATTFAALYVIVRFAPEALKAFGISA
ncbi:MAG TPA: CPBP family intramembrane glutamic endopeptidase [Verrucomicrobiae bacterium]|nr:CPBP family intramembrane glutamic endopeptidase [Verrucomicrobiae bacterium]